MRILAFNSLSLILFAAVAGCSNKVEFTMNEVVTAKGVVEFTTSEIRDKVGKKKWDVKVAGRNLSEQPLLFFLGETQCFKGETQGNLEYAFFGVGERSIDLKIGQRKEWRFLCAMPKVVEKGDYTLKFARIYENPNNDGKTTGKVLAKDFKIEIKAPKKG